MKKRIIIFMAMFFTASLVFAQKSSFNKGDKVLNLGLGLGSTLYSGSYYTSKIPPISVSYEVGLRDNLIDVDNLNLGIGGYLGYSSSRYEAAWGTSTYGWNYSYMILGIRGSLHYPVVDKLDTYAGLMLGYNIVSSKKFGDWSGAMMSASSSSMAFAFYLGGRYYINDKFGVMAELGYGIAYLNIGVALRL